VIPSADFVPTNVSMNKTAWFAFCGVECSRKGDITIRTIDINIFNHSNSFNFTFSRIAFFITIASTEFVRIIQVFSRIFIKTVCWLWTHIAGTGILAKTVPVWNLSFRADIFLCFDFSNFLTGKTSQTYFWNYVIYQQFTPREIVLSRFLVSIYLKNGGLFCDSVDG